MAGSEQQDYQQRLGRALNDMLRHGDSLSEAASENEVNPEDLAELAGGFIGQCYYDEGDVASFPSQEKE